VGDEEDTGRVEGKVIGKRKRTQTGRQAGRREVGRKGGLMGKGDLSQCYLVRGYIKHSILASRWQV
jgi:hypothetical protein